MLKTLALTSFALIDRAMIAFDRGFHVLTGETGAGKTLLIQAIHLLSGHKASADMIRKGCEKGVIEATFDIEDRPEALSLLREGGIECDPEELLIVRREIFRSSKNQIFINAQPAPLSLLSRLGPLLLELVSQNSSQAIRDKESQQRLLDLYGGIDLAPFQNSYAKEKELEKSLLELREKTPHMNLEALKWELKEWEAFHYQEGEEESLFNTYKELANSQETTEKLLALQQGLDHPHLIPTLSQLRKLANTPSLKEHLESAIAHLQEASFTVTKELDSLEHSPETFQELEERLSTLNHLKRKYHIECDEIPSHLDALRFKIDTLEHLDERIEGMEKELSQLREINKKLAEALTKKRTQTAKALEKRLSEELRSLNLPHARAIITLSPKKMGGSGSDEITYFLAANKGEEPSSLSNRTSGGEISRFLLAFKILLAEKGSLPTLIFDEIDANIGGETATLIGQKLKTLGKKCQVLAITHFPQVARYGDHHLQITKQEKDGRTLTSIKPLTATDKDQELLRMLGGETLNFFPS
ncbi:MAG: DNA repair protein RecN [Chlamydiia bacterium]|nr:DNA repair protein RecN [Chlamydiia bacterium]